MPTEFAGQSPLTFLIALPLLAGLLIWLVPPLRKAARQIAMVVSLLVLAGFGYVVYLFSPSHSGEQLVQVNSWISAFGASYAVGVNGVSLTLIGLSVVLVPIVMLAGWNEVKLPAGIADPDGKALAYRQAGFVALLLITEAFMVAIFAARDIFLFYVLFEAMLIPIYFLIGVYGGSNRRAAAVKFLLYSLAGGLIMLAGVVGLYFTRGGGAYAYLFDSVKGMVAAAGPGGFVWVNPTVEMLLFLSFFVAFAIKAPLVPVHTWLPDAASQATPGTSTLLVGVLDKVGTYGMLLLCVPLFPDASRQAAPVIVILALISLIYGGIVAIGQKDIMRLVAFTSVSHFGLIVLGIYIGSETALLGALIYMVAHGVSTAGMFLSSGFLTQRGQSQDMNTYSGMQRVTPVLAAFFLISGLATLALPGLSGFVPEYLVLLGSFQAHWWAGVVTVTGVVLSALYILLAYQRVFTGQVKPGREGIADLGVRERVVMGATVVLILVLGIYPAPVLDALRPVADSFATFIGSLA